MTKKILVVDDEKEIADFLSWLLKDKLGVEVHTADHGEAALQLIKDHQFSLVLSDIRMPVMTGLQMLEKLKTLGVFQPPVIFLTGFGDKRTIEKAKSLGCHGILEKPLEPDALVYHIKTALDSAK